ncbi:hypothetical protein HRbin10_02140 [bacterium HR10]|nr:hypothetical protein HRbin10_02140 [bacterium HR10]
MRLFEEAQSGANDVGDAPPHEFDLQLHRMVMRPIEHGDLRERHPFFVQLQNARGDEGRLLVDILRGHKSGLRSIGTPRAQRLRELPLVVADGGVGQSQDLWRAAIVRLQAVDARVRIALGELVDVAEIGPAPAVDRLAVVADDHDVAVPPGQPIHDLRLQTVRVLIFVHEDVLELLGVEGFDLRVLREQSPPIHEQVIVIHHILAPLALGVLPRDALDLRQQRLEVREAREDDLLQRSPRVAGEAEDVLQDFPAREPPRAGIQATGAHACLEQLARILAVEDGEVRMIAERLRVPAQEAIGDVMEGPTPNSAALRLQKRLDALEHAARGLVGEGHQQHARLIHALLHEPGDAIRDHARLARAGACDHQRRPFTRGDRGVLLLVQFGSVIDQRAPDRRALDDVPSHLRALDFQEGRSRECHGPRAVGSSSEASGLTPGERGRRPAPPPRSCCGRR